MKLAAKRALAQKIHAGNFDGPLKPVYIGYAKRGNEWIVWNPYLQMQHLKGMNIGGLPDTERAREAMEAHAEMLKKASADGKR